jgi:hypothetical protein
MQSRLAVGAMSVSDGEHAGSGQFEARLTAVGKPYWPRLEDALCFMHQTCLCSVYGTLGACSSGGKRNVRQSS